MNFNVGILIFFLFPLTCFCQEKNPPVQITPLTENFYIFTTWNTYNGTPFPSNGMYAVTSNAVVMIDTPWDTTQVNPLLDSIEARHHKKVILCVATHFHDDRTGGFEILKKAQVETWSSELTKLYCIKNNNPLPNRTFLKDTIFQIDGLRFEIFYPGPAHSPDNIVVWFPQQKILYGGCMIKSVDSGGLGNLSDADTHSWGNSIKNIQKKYPKPRFIIPGHQDWNSTISLKHTLQLLSKAEKAK